MLHIKVNEDLLLRTYEAEDAEELFAVIHKNREHLRPWLLWVDATQTVKDSEQFILDSLYQLETEDGIAMGIFYKKKLVGGIGMLHRNHHLQLAHIGYWLDKDFEGQGLMLLSTQQFISYIFNHLNINKLEIRFVPENKRSASLATKLHAKVEGILRDSFLQNGVFKDVVVTGILKKEWS
jgi:ribosomal-protein-serine acetyltransferase